MIVRGLSLDGKTREIAQLSGAGTIYDSYLGLRWWFQICFNFTSKHGEDFQFDLYFSDGLVQPPTRYFIQFFLDMLPGWCDLSEANKVGPYDRYKQDSSYIISTVQ